VLEGLLAERAAALTDGHRQRGRRTAVEQLGQRHERVQPALGVLLSLGLFPKDEPVDVVRHGHDRAERQDRGEPAADHGGQLLVEPPCYGRAQPGVGDDAGAVAVGEQRPAALAGSAGEPVLPGLAVAGRAHPVGQLDRLGHPVEQFLLVADMPVQRGRLDAQFGGEPAHRQPVQPHLVEQPQCRLDDRPRGQPGLFPLVHHLTA
jgi:hypothetical protein